MRFPKTALALIIALVQPAAGAEDAASILRKMMERQTERYEGVNAYIADQTALGFRVSIAFSRSEITATDGTTYPIFKPTSATASQPNDVQHMSEADYLNEFSKIAQVVGTEQIDGRSVYHLRAEGLNRRQQMDGQDLVLQTADLWIDTREYVPLQFRMSGTATAQGNTRPITIEKIESDYRNVPGSQMYEPFRQVLRMIGMLSPEQEREAREAQQQIAQFEQQLASMPEEQRKMIMMSMGPQMELLRHAADGGNFEVVTELHKIIINPDPTTLQSMQSIGPSGRGQGTGAAMALPMFNPGAMANPSAAAAAPAAAPAPAAAQAPSDPQAAQKACLEEKIAKAQAAQKKKSGMGRLLGAVGRVASRFGEPELAQAVRDVHTADQTATDLAAAARDLGLTDDEIAECQKI